MKRLSYALLLALFYLPRFALAQSATLAAPTAAMLDQGRQVLQLCEFTDEEGKYSPDSCYVQHVNAGVDAFKRRCWNRVIIEETDAIAILVTYRQKLRLVEDEQGQIDINKTVAPYLFRSLAYEQARQYNLAISDDTTMIAITPLNPVLWNDRCWHRALSGDLADALQDCQKALELAPKNEYALNSTGFVYLKMKNYRSAIAAYEAALSIQPKDANSLYGLGLAERADGNGSQGSQDIATAKQLDTKIATDFNI